MEHTHEYPPDTQEQETRLALEQATVLSEG